jgi:hypothetical protein
MICKGENRVLFMWNVILKTLNYSKQ